MQEVQETYIQFVGQKDLLEEEIATYFSILACKVPWAWLTTVHGMQSQIRLSD